MAAAVFDYQTSFVDFWLNANDVNTSGLTVNVMAERSFDDEFGRVVNNEVGVFIAALFTMLAYLMMTLGDFTLVGARPYLAISAIFVMVCSLGTGFGISAVFQFEFNTVVMLVPFILLGVGVDDMS